MQHTNQNLVDAIDRRCRVIVAKINEAIELLNNPIAPNTQSEDRDTRRSPTTKIRID